MTSKFIIISVLTTFTLILTTLNCVSTASVINPETLDDPGHAQDSNDWIQIQDDDDDEGIENIEPFTAFISYRRSTSRHLAMLIKVMLEVRNISGYLDVEDLEGGDWDMQLMDNIELSPNFILILSNGTLERSKGDFNYTDFLHREIKSAVDLNKRIIPVFDDFDWPPAELFSPEINEALTNQGVTWEHFLVDQSLDRLISYMVSIGPKPDQDDTTTMKPIPTTAIWES